MLPRLPCCIDIILPAAVWHQAPAVLLLPGAGVMLAAAEWQAPHPPGAPPLLALCLAGQGLPQRAPSEPGVCSARLGLGGGWCIWASGPCRSSSPYQAWRGVVAVLLQGQRGCCTADLTANKLAPTILASGHVGCTAQQLHSKHGMEVVTALARLVACDPRKCSAPLASHADACAC